MAAKNDILRDKDGNQIFPATMAEQVSYDGKINVKQAIKRGAVRNKVAPTVASMTDKEQIYVYTGTEDGYTFGNWYYWDGTAWTSGGVYNAIEVNTDRTLTDEGAPADAKATGDKLSELKSDLVKVTSAEYVASKSFEKITGHYVDATQGKIYANADANIAYFECQPNTTYAVGKIADNRFSIGYTKEKPNTNVIVYDAVDKATNDEVIINTGLDAKYVVIFYYLSTACVHSESELFSSLIAYGLFPSANDVKARGNIEKVYHSINRNDFIVADGLFVNGLINQAQSNESASTLYIQCKPNTKYKVNKIADSRFTVCYSDVIPSHGSKTYGAIIDNNASSIEITTNINAKYLIVFYYIETAKIHDKSVVFESIQILEETNSAIDYATRDMLQDIVIVSKSGKYNTIKKGIDAAKANGTVYVHDGIYYEQISTQSKDVHIVGLNKEKCILIDESGDYSTPPIEISGGSVQNMTIIETSAKATPSTTGIVNPTLAYCIHADWDSMENKRLLISNCILKCNKRATIGVGARNGFEMIVENCDLWSGVQEDTTHNPRGAFYAHSQNGTETKRAKIILKNNRIVCDDALTMCLESYGGIGIDFEFIGNTLHSKVNGNSDATIKGTNNENVSFTNGIYKNGISYGNNVSVLN